MWPAEGEYDGLRMPEGLTRGKETVVVSTYPGFWPAGTIISLASHAQGFGSL